MEILVARESLSFFTNLATSPMRLASSTTTTELRPKMTLQRRRMTSWSTRIAVRLSKRPRVLLNVIRLIFVSFLLHTGALGQWKPAQISGFHYPPLALTAGIQGDVLISCTVETDGTVSEAAVISGSGLLKEAAVTAAKRWRFTWESDEPRRGTVKLNFEFRLGNRCKTECCPDKSEILTVYYPDRVQLVSSRPPIVVGPSSAKPLSH